MKRSTTTAVAAMNSVESQEGLKLFSRAYLVGSCLLESHGLHIHLDQLTVRRVAKDNAVGVVVS